jgi:hypothetical protein
MPTNTPLLTVALLTAVASAAVVTRDDIAAHFRQCVELAVPVPVIAKQYTYTQPQVDSTIDAIDWTIDRVTWSSPNATKRIIEPYTVNLTFTINAQLCVPPKEGPKSDILHIATQGRAFDKK